MHRLLVFTRYPEPGRAKTRLIPRLGPEGAAAVHRAAAERTLRRLRAAGEIEVRHEGGDEARMRDWLGAAVRLRPQGGGDFGARLERAFDDAFREGADVAAAVGTDCPDLGEGDVREAFAALATHDVVFGPAADGGYWLVGIRRGAWDSGARALFAGVPWGGPDVLAAGREAAARAGLGVGLLRELRDVDRPGDLPLRERAAGGEGAPARPDLSVVVPTLGEAARIGALVRRLLAEPGVEAVVADGGSADGTRAAAAREGARVVEAPRGRAVQMNAGAAAAAGDALVFLHADTEPPAGFAGLVRETLAREGVAGGAFGFATDSPRRSLRAIERLANWRARRLGIVFGDQGIFLRRELFEELGGYPVQPLLEDRELVRRMRRRGRVVVLAPAAVTSARRWHEGGVWRTSARNVLLTWAYEAGVDPARLARWYRGGAREAP